MTKLLRIDEIYDAVKQNTFEDDPDLKHISNIIISAGNMLAKKLQERLGVQCLPVRWDDPELGGWAAQIFLPLDEALQQPAREALDMFDSSEPLEVLSENETISLTESSNLSIDRIGGKYVHPKASIYYIDDNSQSNNK